MLPIEGSVQILKSDPELGLRVPATQIADARAQLVARVSALDPGRWEVPHDTSSRLGFLMLDGLLARDVVLVGHTCTELLGEGDVIQPWIPSTDDGLVRYHVLWHVLAPSKLAVLDDSFARKLADWPQVMSMLLERAIRRTLRMSIHQALLQLSPVETRLLVLFWHLAERWGRVTPNGISVRLRMSHELLGQLVGDPRTPPGDRQPPRHPQQRRQLAPSRLASGRAGGDQLAALSRDCWLSAMSVSARRRSTTGTRSRISA